jgi:predicted alpha-1,2-mannosidase
MALIAEGLGEQDIAKEYFERGQYYRNLWDPKQKYFAPRNSDGSFGKVYPNMIAFYDEIFGFLGFDFARPYCEGSARHYRWHAPHDPQGLVELFGGGQYFVRELEKFMKDASRSRAALNPGAGYWIGNQHNWHAAYLFNEAGRPDLTQKYARWTLTERFATGPSGYDGNEDGGSLSSWYVLSSVGLYPVAGTDRYWLGAPLFDEAVLQLGGGKQLKITAENQGKKNIYVQSVTLNGTRLAEPSITHGQIANGGVLAFVMGPKPAANGGY